MAAKTRTEQNGVESNPQNYLPGMPTDTPEPGYVGRLLTRLFRERGETYVRVTRTDR